MLEEIYQERLGKLAKIRDELKLDPYGGRYDSAEAIATVVGRYEDWEKAQGGAEAAKAAAPKPQGDAAGRLVLLRDMGKMIFAHIRDESGQMQIALRKDQPGKEPHGLNDQQWQLAKLLDLGDLVAVAGPVERTRTGEVTIWAERLTLLCKSLLPMPEKFHGLTDVETRYRQRYLDLMANPESMRVFRQRCEILELFRSLLKARGFREVETPILQALYGGAAARPFTTHHNTLDCDLFLRISPELYLKRLLVGGLGKVFEIGRNFRNEGIDTRHNPEFTMMELYQAYADYEVMMEITEELVAGAAKMLAQNVSIECARLLGTPDGASVFVQRPDGTWTFGPGGVEEFKYQQAEYTGAMAKANTHLMAFAMQKEGRCALPYGDRAIDFTRPWRRATYEELLQEHAGVSMRDTAAVRAKARALGIEESNKADAVVVGEVFERCVEPALAKLNVPVFVKDYPAELCPLTRRKADDPSIALRFECYVAGMEIANAYTELNDPAVQEANFRQQLAGEAEGETMRVMDEDFVTALRHGMPPAGGLGIGIDRVVMLLTNRTSIRDVVLFPMLRPETAK